MEIKLGKFLCAAFLCAKEADFADGWSAANPVSEGEANDRTAK